MFDMQIEAYRLFEVKVQERRITGVLGRKG